MSVVRLASIALWIALGLPAVSRAEDVYSPGGWSTLHRGPANRKLVSSASLDGPHRIWTALEGASVLTAPTMSPDGRTLYVATGREAGHSNLHAFDLDGALRWEAPAWQDPDLGVDPCAILSSPIVDREGVVYLGDCNQVFAFSSSGALEWVVPLPETRDGDWRASATLPINALTTAAFTKQGHLFGVTNFGDIIVLDRKTGRSVAAPMRLPGLLPPPSAVAMPESTFGDGLVDPEIREWAWQLLFGGSMRSANTPAVDLESGRIFVAATSQNEGKGALYALDLTPVGEEISIEIAWATDMGPGSGSSPSLSPSGELVYVSDEEGLFYAVDARSGAIVWQVETRAASAAAAVGANGDIFALQAYGPALIAITEAGAIRWQSDLRALAEQALPSSWLLGEPQAIGNGNPTVVGDVVLVPVAYGYETSLGRRIPWPVASSLVAVDARTGKGLRDVVALADDSTGITVVLPDGTIVNSLGTAITSGVAPLAGLASWLLPGDLELLAPVGGIQVSRPPQPEQSRLRQRLERVLAERPAVSREQDAHRQPAAVLEIAGVEPGMTVADLMAGSGWYSEVLAHAVGPTGRVLAQNNAISAARYGDALRDRLAAQPLPQVETSVRELDALGFEAEALDLALMVQFYHDTVWMGVDRAAMNRQIFDALRPGGVFLVIDHAAPDGAGLELVKTLHRIDADSVRREIEAAGFRLTGSSSLLAGPEDDRTLTVFDPSVRGRTDRFLLRFEKPSDGPPPRRSGTASGIAGE